MMSSIMHYHHERAKSNDGIHKPTKGSCVLAFLLKPLQPHGACVENPRCRQGADLDLGKPPPDTHTLVFSWQAAIV